MAKFLITGGAGFIGSNLVEHLVNQNQTVRVVDNLSTGKFKNIEPLIDKIDFICGDLTDCNVARRAVEDMDCIIHLAAVSSVSRSINDPIITNASIVNASLNLYKAAVDSQNIKRIVQATSSSIYGNTPNLPMREDMIPNPLSPYSVAKLAQEHYGRVFSEAYGLEVISLRCFSVFGPKQDPDSFYAGVIPKFIHFMLKGQAPLIYGDGNMSRDFTYIANVIQAILLACSCKWPGKSVTINVGCGERLTLNELVSHLNQLLRTNIQPVYDFSRRDIVKDSLADISKAQNLLGYEVKVHARQGMEKMIHEYISMAV